VVLSTRDGRPTVLTQDRRHFRLSARDLADAAPSPVARIDLPRSGSARSARFRRDLAARLATLNVHAPKARAARSSDPDAERQARALERQAAQHPCHACPDRPQHERWAERASKLEREVAALDRRIRSRTETLGRQFDRVVAVLQQLGCVRGFSLTEKGEQLRQIYAEGDILVVEAVARGLFDGLSPSEAAALLSAIVYESRERVPRRTEIPTRRLRDRFRDLSDIWAAVRKSEDSHQVELVRELDAGFMPTVFDWAEGKPLEDVLATSGLTPGDFVRNCKQLLDLLRQVETVAGPEVAAVARAAHQSVNRSVVSYTGLEA
jgi:ATP-dependent RNA helicase HelY